MVHVLYLSAPLNRQNKAVLQNLTVDMLDKNSVAGILMPTTGTDSEPNETTPHRQTTPSINYMRHFKVSLSCTPTFPSVASSLQYSSRHWPKLYNTVAGVLTYRMNVNSLQKQNRMKFQFQFSYRLHFNAIWDESTFFRPLVIAVWCSKLAVHLYSGV